MSYNASVVTIETTDISKYKYIIIEYEQFKHI